MEQGEKHLRILSLYSLYFYALSESREERGAKELVL